MYHFIINLWSNSLFQKIILQSLLIIYQTLKSVIDWKFTKLKIKHSFLSRLKVHYSQSTACWLCWVGHELRTGRSSDRTNFYSGEKMCWIQTRSNCVNVELWWHTKCSLVWTTTSPPEHFENWLWLIGIQGTPDENGQKLPQP